MLWLEPDHVSRTLSVKEFAARAGVTVKTLHHYDRIGLLVPARTASGYRAYSPADLTRMQQIVVLRSLGLPLGRIANLLAADGPPLREVLEQQRLVLEGQRRLLDTAILALARADAAMRGPSADLTSVLSTLTEAIHMQDSIDAMRRYYSDEVWTEWKRHYEHWPSEGWRALYRDVNAALDAEPALDPAGDVAQQFASRWLALDADETTIPAVRTGLRRAWADREHWPDALRERLAALNADRAACLVGAALWERWDAERVARERSGAGAPPRVSGARCRLYRDGAALLGQPPSSPDVQALVGRWRAILDAETGGDEETRVEVLRGFRTRHRWPAGLTRSVAASYEMDAVTWAAVANLIEAGDDYRASPHGPAPPS